MTTRRGLSLDVIDVAGHEVGMERTVLRTRTTSALVIGRPRPLQILGYRRISPGFWWLSNASALAFEHRECSERDRRLGWREREYEYVYVCVRVRVIVCRERVGSRREVSWTLRWISGTHIYPSLAERDTGIGIGGGTCEHGRERGGGGRRTRKREVTPTV